MRPLIPTVLVIVTVLSTPSVHALNAVNDDSVVDTAPIYRWRDGAGRLHFSNRPEQVPPSAGLVALTPVAIGPARTRPGTSAPEVAPRREPATGVVEGCQAADETGVASAVAGRLSRRHIEGLTLLVASAPLAHGADAVVTHVVPDENRGGLAAAQQDPKS